MTTIEIDAHKCSKNGTRTRCVTRLDGAASASLRRGGATNQFDGYEVWIKERKGSKTGEANIPASSTLQGDRVRSEWVIESNRNR